VALRCDDPGAVVNRLSIHFNSCLKLYVNGRLASKSTIYTRQS